MNFYKRFMGDYGKDTAHLSLAEHGAYTLLLDHYYSTELPLPAEYPALYRICRAFEKAEQRAVNAVADAFFPIGEDGLRTNARADRQMFDDKNRIESARDNGKKGGRPKKQTQTEPNNNPVGFDSLTQQEPTTKAHHSQSKEVKDLSENSDVVGSRFPEFWESWPKTDRKTAKAECLKKWKLRSLDRLADQILLHLAAMKSTKKWQDGYEPAPLTYINQKHWEDGMPGPENALNDIFEGAI